MAPTLALCLLFSILGPSSRATTQTCDGQWREYPANEGDRSVVLQGAAVLDPNDAWAVGFERPDSGGRQPFIERWDGTAWAPVSSPGVSKGSAQLLDVDAVTADDAWAVGGRGSGGSRGTFVLHWNGTEWTRAAAPSPLFSRLRGVSMVSSDDVWAVGTEGVNGRIETLAEHWNGTEWSEVRIPDPGDDDNVLAAVSATSASFALAVGWREARTQPAVIEQWDGTRWRSLRQGWPGAQRGVWALRSTEAWSAGPPALHWDGTDWVETPLPWDGMVVNGVSGRSRVGVWAAGSRPAGTASVAAIARWTGERWIQSNAPTPEPGPSAFRAVAASEPAVWAVGWRRPPGSAAPGPLILGVC